MNYQVIDGVNDRGAARMLGAVLRLMLVIVALTAVAVIGGCNILQDAADAHRKFSFTKHQETIWETADAVAAQPGVVAAQAEFDAANLHAQATAIETSAQAEDIKALADADAYRRAKEEETRVQAERDQLALTREEKIGQAAIYVGALAAAMAILLLGLVVWRLVDRFLPARPRAAGPQPPIDSRPAGSSRPQPPRPAPAAPQPKRQPAAPAPAPLLFTADSPTHRSASDARPSSNGGDPKGQRPATPPRRLVTTH